MTALTDAARALETALIDRRTAILMALTPDEHRLSADHQEGMFRIGRHLVNLDETGKATAYTLPDSESASGVMHALMDDD